jgi:hypothetical protein
MAFSVSIYTEAMVLVDTLTEADAASIFLQESGSDDPHYEINTDGYGDCLSLGFLYIQDGLFIPPNGIIAFEHDSTNLFWGRVALCPAENVEAAGSMDEIDGRMRVECVGGSDLLSRALVGYKHFPEGTPTYEVVEYYLQNYMNNAMNTWFSNPTHLNTAELTSPDLIETTEPAYYPMRSVKEALDILLAHSGDWVYGIDRTGIFYVKAML